MTVRISLLAGRGSQKKNAYNNKRAEVCFDASLFVLEENQTNIKDGSNL
jgi:hypothetical protein